MVPVRLPRDVHHRLVVLRLLAICRLTKAKPQTVAVLDNCLSQQGTLLTDTTCKHEPINLAASFDVVAPDVSEDAVYEYVEGELVSMRGWVFNCDLGEVGCACEGFPAGLLVENVFGLYANC